MKKLFEIIVPKYRDNQDGTFNVVSQDTFDALFQYCVELSGGLTVLPESQGMWVNPDGKLVSEPVIPVRVIVTAEQALSIAKLVAIEFNQKEVLVYEVSNGIILVPNEPKEGN